MTAFVSTSRQSLPRHVSCSARLVMLLVGVLSAAMVCDTAGADDYCAASVDVRDDDEVWLVSTRDFDFDCCDGDYQVSRFTAGRWYSDETHNLHNQINVDGDRQNLIFVHGNRTDLSWARERGLWVYHQIVGSAENAPPVRFVIWAWPSDRQYRLLRDFRFKAQLSDRQGRLLGEFLEQIDPSTDLSMVGYSFGARLVLGGIASAETASDRLRLALVAAATHRQWIYPGGQHQTAYDRAESMLLVNNRRDPALRNYGFLERGGLPAALGEYGVCNLSGLTDGGSKISQVDVSGFVGRKHDISRYFASPAAIEHIRRITLKIQP